MKLYLNRVGADIEVFFKDKNNMPVPVIGLVGGTKDEPIRVNVLGYDDGYSAVQEDNVMAEFNVCPAQGHDSQYFVRNTKAILAHVEKLAEEKGLLVDISPAMKFKADQLKHKQAQHVGCNPDWNAWTLQINKSLDAGVLKNIRTAGGHVHVSFTTSEGDADDVTRAKVVRMMDLYHGVPSVLLDDDVVRRRFYGKAGAYRAKEYGVEYRVLSNWWIRKPEYMAWVVENTNKVFQHLNSHDMNIPVDDCKNIIRAINDNNKKLAKELIAKYNIPIPQ